MIDLQNSFTEGDKIISLDGKWEFFPDLLLSEDDFEDQERLSNGKAQLTDVPSTWFNPAMRRNSGELARAGTYRLVIHPPPSAGNLALYVRDIHAAYRLWINRKLVTSRGKLSATPEAETPFVSVDCVRFENTGQPIELLVEVTNHHYPSGGITRSILLGEERTIEERIFSETGAALLILGFLIATAMFSLSFFIYHRGTRISFYLSLFILSCIGQYVSASSSNWLIRLLDKDLSSELLCRVQHFSFFCSIPLCYSFLRATFPHEFSRQMQWVWRSVFFSLAVIALTLDPFSNIYHLLPAAYFLTLCALIYALTHIVKAKLHGRDGANLLLGGFLFLALVAVNDMLHDLRIVHSYYLQGIGFVCLIISQQLWVITRFSSSLRAVQRLTHQLRSRNRALATEMGERQKLEGEILKISEDERREISHQLHDGVCQDLVAAKLYCSMLQDNGQSSRETLDPGACSRPLAADYDNHASLPLLQHLAELIDSTVDRAYALSRGLWPIETNRSGTIIFLDEFCRKTSQATRVDVNPQFRLWCESCVNPHMTQILRIAQEAITNAVKHSKSERIDVIIDCESCFPELNMTVRDHGIGPRDYGDATHGGLGMRIMAHRAHAIGGILTISGDQTYGTEVRCKVACSTYQNTEKALRQ